jgi:uncharacterized delta-60 repeat protein
VLKQRTGGGQPAVIRRWALRGVAVVVLLAAGLGVGVALAGSGGLDPTFGTGGTTVLERPTSTYPTRAGLVAGGKIVTVSTSNGVITVSRLLANGAPDPTFDGDGQATIESEGFPSAYALAIQPDGKIVLVGFRGFGGTGEHAMVWRLNADGGSGAPNGALDPTFGTKGVVEIGTYINTVGRAVAIQPDGKIVAAGKGFNTTGPNKIAVWRLTASGALDPSFDTDGTAEISDTSEDDVNAIALAPDGKIVVAGTTELATHPRDAVVWRLQADGGSGVLNGALDTTFDTDGQADIDGGGDDAAEGVAVQPDGKIVLAGYGEATPAHRDAMVWRLKADGGSGVTNNALDPSFDTDGAAAIDGGGTAYASALALQPDGKILITGASQVGKGPGSAAVWRLAANGGTGEVNGALDPTFGTGGATTVSVGSGAGANALALAPDRRIVAVGSTSDEKLLVFRTLGDPFALTVTKGGTGSGSVQSSPPGIDCGASCSAPFDDGVALTLTATPAAGSAFAGWSGAGCSGIGACTLTMSAEQAVTATFNAVPAAPPVVHFVLKASALSMKGFKRSAKTAFASITGLPPGTLISASIRIGRRTLAKVKAIAGSDGKVHFKFTFAKGARRRLRAAKLQSVTLVVTATPKGEGASKASKSVKLKRKRQAARRAS